MQSWKKLILLAAMSAVSGGVFAMEALPDAALAEATGQAGLTITADNYDIQTTAVRYYDSDGFSAAGIAAYNLGVGSPQTVSFPAIPGPCSGLTNVQCVAGFSSGGSLNFNALSVSNYHFDQVVTTIDAGSTGTGAAAKSGLLVGTSLLNGLSLNTGGISIDNGDELNGTLGAGGATNGATYDSEGVLTGGSDLGGIAVLFYSSTRLLALVSGGAPDLGTNSGLTITSLLPLDMIVYFSYYDTSKQKWQGGDLGSTNTLDPLSQDGLLLVPIYIYGLNLGPLEIAVGQQPVSSYATTSSEALQIYSSGITATAISIGGASAGDTGIQIAGSDAGSVGIVGLSVGPQHIAISGH
jgi:hypothetical protein